MVEKAINGDLEEMRKALLETRAWCASLEQQQAELAAVLSLTTPGAIAALTRFPLRAALADELPVHREK